MRKLVCVSRKVQKAANVHTGAFSPHPGHDVNVHPTLSAIQILATHDALHLLKKDKLVTC